MGSQFPDQGSNPCPLYEKCGVLTTGPLGKSLFISSVRTLHWRPLTSICKMNRWMDEREQLTCLWSWVALGAMSWSRVSSQSLKSGHDSESTESEPLDHQGQWPVTRPWPILEIGVKQVMCLLGGKRVHADRHTGRLRETELWFELLLWGASAGFPLANHLALPGSESVLGVS